MTKRLLNLLGIILTVVCVHACNGSSSNSDVQYVAQITCDEKETTLQLVRLSNVAQEEPESEVIIERNLGYGALKFMLNQGSVPDEEDDVPDFCKYRSDLGEEDAGPCVFQPLLDSLSKMTAQLCIEKGKIALDISYNAGGNGTYPQLSIESLDETLNLYILGQGYEVETGMLTHTHGAYRHSEGACQPGHLWMATIKDNVTLSRISMPGTHDTMARVGGVGANIWKTQSMNLWDQLTSGIRALDIRCRHHNNKFPIHHGSIYQNANFNDVLSTCKSFLNYNKTETIVMRVTEEYTPSGNTRTFAETFNVYASGYPELIWKYSGNNNPTLEEVRGKVVILQDFPPWNQWVGIPWKNAVIQDDYKFTTNWDLYGKWEKVRNHIAYAATGNKDMIYINFLSGSVGSFPYFVASGKLGSYDSAPLLSTGITTLTHPNTYPDFPRVSCLGKWCTIAFLGTNCLTDDLLRKYPYGRVGIIMADFPGPSLINSVVLSNFKPFHPPL